MKKRISCLLLALALIVGLLPAVQAADDPGALEMTVSEAGVAWVKEFEGFAATAYQDGASWYIGYGVRCEAGQYPNGISEQEADAMLREHLQEAADALNPFLQKIGFTPNQAQFDALASFTFNVGTGWMWIDSKLEKLLTEGFSAQDEAKIVHAFGIWCHQNGEVHPVLVRRRLTEACAFLYGDYDATRINEFVYLELDKTDCKVENDIVFYKKGTTYGTLPTAEREGYTFYGWQTETGERLNELQIATENRKVSPIWTEPEPWQNPYSDVEEDDWFYPYVSTLSQDGVIDGYPDGTFRPEEMTELGAALKLCLLAAGYPEQTAVTDHWASGYLYLAQAYGLLDEAAPDLDSAVSRLTIAHVAARALGLEEVYGVSPFADTDDGAVTALYQAGILAGSYQNGVLVFRPDSGLTRAELTVIVWKLQSAARMNW